MRIAIAFLISVTVIHAQSPATSRRPGFAPQQMQPQQPTDCAADGTVVNSATGQLLPRANVIVSSGNGSGTSTDATGKWTISNLTCGPVTFTAEKEGFIQNNFGRALAGPLAGGMVKPVVLVSGSPVHDLKIELMPESVVTGRVLDEAGDPATSAQVRGMMSVVQNGRRTMQMFRAATTDSTGTYRLGGLTAGRYVFCATSNRVRYPVGGGSPATYGENCYPGPLSGGAASTLQIEGGKEVRADFTLTPVTGVHVRGMLTGLPPGSATGAGSSLSAGPFASVQMFRTEANGGFMPGAVRPQTVRNGKFEFSNVTPGAYTLRANTQAGGETLFATALIDVGSTDVEGISMVFQPGSPVSGTLVIENVAPPVAQTDQQQAVAQLNAQNASNRPPVNVNLNPLGLGGPMGRIQWDADHKSFTIPDVQAGKYRINVTTAGGGYFVKSVMLHDQELRDQELTVSGPTGPIQIVISNESGSLQGTVTDGDGKPAASQIMLKCGVRPMFMGRSQEDGTIRMQNIPAGPCKAWAFEDGRNVEYADEDWMRRYAGSGGDVTIVSGSAAQVNLVRRTVPQ